jgi:hypothetical protein
MSNDVTLADAVVEAIRNAKILGVRAGAVHRYTGIWVVVVDGRVFVRSWNDKPTGWFRVFRIQPSGTIQVGGLEIPVRAKLARSARIRDGVTVAFGEKYHTKASRKGVKGFAEPARVLTTLELVRAKYRQPAARSVHRYRPDLTCRRTSACSKLATSGLFVKWVGRAAEGEWWWRRSSFRTSSRGLSG